jgi:oxalate decarboxylase
VRRLKTALRWKIPVTQRQRIQMVLLRESGMTQPAIAAAIGVSLSTAMRSMHWHPNADEWQYYIKGKARMGVFNTGPQVRTMDFNPGDIGYVPRNYGHYVQNVGDTDMQFFAVFRTPNFQEMSLSDWLKHSPAEMVAEHLNVDDDGPALARGEGVHHA